MVNDRARFFDLRARSLTITITVIQGVRDISNGSMTVHAFSTVIDHHRPSWDATEGGDSFANVNFQKLRSDPSSRRYRIPSCCSSFTLRQNAKNFTYGVGQSACTLFRFACTVLTFCPKPPRLAPLPPHSMINVKKLNFS